MRVVTDSDLTMCARAVDHGETVILPTRRWYMLCADVGNPEACARIFAGKNRSASKPLALVLPTNEAAAQLFVLDWAARALIDAFWPGDLALVLPRRDVHDLAIGEAVGHPNALVTRDPGLLGQLSGMTARPLATAVVSNSAAVGNTDPGPAITVAEVAEFVAASAMEIAFAVDGGICPARHHLTVVNCTGPTPRITRAGLVHERAVGTALAEPSPPRGGESGRPVHPEGDAPASPPSVQ